MIDILRWIVSSKSAGLVVMLGRELEESKRCNTPAAPLPQGDVHQGLV